MAFPVILWRNLLAADGAVLNASSTDPEVDVTEVANDRAWDPWKAGSVIQPITIDVDLGLGGELDADCLGLVNCNLASQSGKIAVKYGSTFPPTNTALAATFASDINAELFHFAAPGPMRFWRLELSRTSDFLTVPFIGDAWLGLKTQLPEFPDPDLDPFMQQDEVVSQRSKGGQFLGAIIRGQQHRQELRFGGDTGIVRSFFSSDLNLFYTSHAMQRRPFFFQYDRDDSELKRAFFLKVPDDQILSRIPVGGVTTRFKGSLWVEEAWMGLP